MSFFGRLDLGLQVRQLEEPDVALGRGLLLHHLPRDLQEQELDALLLGRLDHQVVEPHLPLPAQDVQLPLLELDALVHGRVDLGDGHRGVHRADVDHGPALLAVQVGHACHRLGAIELENEGQVLVESLLGE